MAWSKGVASHSCSPAYGHGVHDQQGCILFDEAAGCEDSEESGVMYAAAVLLL